MGSDSDASGNKGTQPPKCSMSLNEILAKLNIMDNLMTRKLTISN